MPAPRNKRFTEITVQERVDIGQRISIGLIALSLGLISLALGLAFLNSPSALLIVPNLTSNVTASSATAVTLTWTAPGDDGDIGTASSYDIRYSTAPITDVNFSSATPVSNPPAPMPAGTTESFSVTNLNPSTTYFFALKASDEAGNMSQISNVATKTTDAAPQACVPTYSCTTWSACTDGRQTRTCTVTNNCSSNLDQPVTSQACTPSVGGSSQIQNPIVVAGVAVNTIPVVRTIDYRSSKVLHEWLAFPRSDRSGVHVATGDVTGDHRAEIVVGTGIGSDPLVKIFTDSGEQLAQFNPYPTSRGIGVSVTTGDVDGDGTDEILTVAAGSAAHVRIFKYHPDSQTVEAIAQTFAYHFSQRNGFTITAGDIDLDGKDEFVVSARTNALTLSVFKMNSDRTIQRVSKFSPYGILFNSGITLAVGDVNGDGTGDIITSPGPGYWSHIKVFTLHGSLIGSFLPTSTAYRGGVDLASSDINGDGREEILTGSYSRGDPSVWAFRYNGLTKNFERISSMFVFPRTMQDGLRIDATPHQ